MLAGRLLMLSEVRLDAQEWSQVLQILSQAPWAVANPLIMKIGEQLRAQAPRSEADVYMEAARKEAPPRPNGPE
jgi:hypothetical protein